MQTLKFYLMVLYSIIVSKYRFRGVHDDRHALKQKDLGSRFPCPAAKRVDLEAGFGTTIAREFGTNSFLILYLRHK